MTKTPSDHAAADSQAPFGTEPRGSAAPLVLLGLLYLAWLAVLFWLAAFRPGS